MEKKLGAIEAHIRQLEQLAPHQQEELSQLRMQRRGVLGGLGRAKALHGRSISADEFKNAYAYLTGQNLSIDETVKAIKFLQISTHSQVNPHINKHARSLTIQQGYDGPTACKILEARVGYSLRQIKRKLGLTK